MGVVGQAHLAAEQVAQVGDGAQVAVLRAGRIGAGALEQHDVLAAAGAQGAHGLVQLGQGGHAGGDDHRLAGGGDLADQRQVGVLEGGDLIAGGPQVFEKVDGGVIEGGAEGDQPQRLGPFDEGGMPFPGRAGDLVQLVQALAVPEAALVVDEEIAGADWQGHGVGGVGLELDGKINLSEVNRVAAYFPRITPYDGLHIMVKAISNT